MNNKNVVLCILALLMSLFLFGCASARNEPSLNDKGQYDNKIRKEEINDENTVRNIVERFGLKLQMVSLQVPRDVLEKSMKENYGEFVSKALIEKWISDPLNAPGRLTSSPWPDRIEILKVEKISQAEYKVNGEIIEITSVEKESGGVAAKRSITLTVRKINDNWLIDDVLLGEYNEEG